MHTELGSYELAGYGRVGVTLRTFEEEITFFVHWGAVIQLQEDFQEHNESLY